jgi:hypothetical protein
MNEELLWQDSTDSTSSSSSRIIPQLPEPSYGLVPFARIESTRSSWIVPSDNNNNMPPTSPEAEVSSWSNRRCMGLSVDLDVTTYGYAVGEVETIVHEESNVAEARERIQQFLNQLLLENTEATNNNSNNNNNKTTTTTTVGKLEYYLIKYRPDHYQACLQSGSLTSNHTS